MGWFVAVGTIVGLVLLGWLVWWSSGRAAPAPHGHQDKPPAAGDSGSGMAGLG